jgi:hypothetical protein
VDVVGVFYNLQNQVSKFSYTIHNILILSTLVGLDKLEYVLLLKVKRSWNYWLIQMILGWIHDICSYICKQVCATTIHTIDINKFNVCHTIYNALPNLWTIIICMKLFDLQWHNWTSVMGECKLYGM